MLALLHKFVYEFRGNNTYIIQDRPALLWMFVIPNLLNCIYLVALNLLVNNHLNSSTNSTHHWSKKLSHCFSVIFFLLDYKECPFFRLKMSGDHKDQHPSSTESKNIHLFKFQNRYGENAIITTTGEVKQKDIEDYFETIVKNRILPKG